MIDHFDTTVLYTPLMVSLNSPQLTFTDYIQYGVCLVILLLLLIVWLKWLVRRIRSFYMPHEKNLRKKTVHTQPEENFEIK